MVDRGQASPSGVESIWVLDAGQTGASPSMRTVHRVGSGIIGTDDACVDGWASR